MGGRRSTGTSVTRAAHAARVAQSGRGAGPPPAQVRRCRRLRGPLVVIVAAVLTAIAPALAPPAAAAPPAHPAAVPAAAVPAQPRTDPPEGSSSAAAAEAGARAAEAQARAAAQAARRAAQAAQASQRARATWESRGRPAKLVVVRTTSLDQIDNGRLTRRALRAPGDMTLPLLDRYLPASWLSIDDGTARLAAAVVLTPGTTLDVGGGDLTRLQLAGGPRLRDAASLYTGSGRLVVHGVTVTSADPASGQALPPSAGRPFVVVSPAGRLEATDSTFSDLGTPTTGEDDRPGVQFNAGSGGSLVRTALNRNSGPLLLRQTQDVRLQDVTVSESAGDGMLLADDRGTTLAGIRAVRNRDDGVHVTGTGTDRPITGITTADNGGFGISTSKVSGIRISGIRTSGDASGGIELSQSSGVTVSELTATDEPVGVYTHVGTTDTVLDRLTITGGRRGVNIEKSTQRLILQSSTIERATVAGIGVGGTAVELRDVTVRDSHTNIRVERGADGLTAAGVSITGGQDGVVLGPGTAGVVLRDLSVYGVENDAVRSFSPDARIVGGKITGAVTGLNLAAATTVSGMVIQLVDNGIRSRSPGPVSAEDVHVDAVDVGIDAAGNPFAVSGSTVHALESVRGTLTETGTNDLSLPPLNLLGAIGIPLVLLALVLQLIHVLRQRRTGERSRRPAAPQLPTGRAVPRDETGRRIAQGHHRRAEA